MDSCQIFNFLFGSRKVTSELNKHFRASFNDSTASSRQRTAPKSAHSNAAGGQQPEQAQQPPRSPLKQIQLRIANLANSVRRPAQDESGPIECCSSEFYPKCGTYHAKLVRSSEPPDQDREELVVDENNNVRERGNLDNQKQVADSSEATDNPTGLLASTSRPAAEEAQKLDEAAGLPSANLSESQCTPSGQEGGTAAAAATASRGRRTDKSERVRNLVQSFESSMSESRQNSLQSSESIESPRMLLKSKWTPEQEQEQEQQQQQRDTCKFGEKPTTLVKPLPPKTPPKSSKVKFINLQLRLNKPNKIEQIFQDESFLLKFFNKLEPIDRCAAAQVCRTWRNILYSNQDYWRDLISVIDCNQLRREHLLECIVNKLQSAKLKQNNHSNNHPSNAYHNSYHHTNLAPSLNGAWNVGQRQQQQQHSNQNSSKSESCTVQTSLTLFQRASSQLLDLDTTELDQDEVWRIQELCQKFARGTSNTHSSRSLASEQQQQQIGRAHV